MSDPVPRVRVSEIYASIQGESTWAGTPCVFVRLTGCPLRCVWCDTTHAFAGGSRRSVDEVVGEAQRFGLPLVEVTGGEPLTQDGAPALLARLADAFPAVLLETSGAFSIAGLDPRVHVILDLKAPGSGEESRNLPDNPAALSPGDELKVVVADRRDYEWVRERVRAGIAPPEIPVLLSPVHGGLAPAELAAWMVEDRLPARLQLQQHKFIWPADARGV